MGKSSRLKLLLGIAAGSMLLVACSDSAAPEQQVHFSLGEDPSPNSTAIYVLYDFVQTQILDEDMHQIELVETDTEIQVFITVPPAIDGPLISQSLARPETDGPYGHRIDLENLVGDRDIVNGHLPEEPVRLHHWLLS